jgi:calcium-translocating P-type ATPase
LERETVLADRHNMAYSSTLVTYGTGAGLVVGTGDSTEIGHINALISSAELLATPLTRKITQFSGVLLWIILALAGLTILAGWLHGGSLLETFMAAVALAVGAIPEGLPAAMTIMLAIGVGKMARRNAIIRRMPAVETLGSTTVICSDKTGTLTQNQMTVKEVCAGGECFEFSGAGYAPEGNISTGGFIIDPDTHGTLTECLRAGLLCNDSRLVQSEGKWGIEGDPTEAALVSAALKGGLSDESSVEEYPRLDTLPFESEHQYMATLHRSASKANGVIYLKGSVESVISRCHQALDASGAAIPLDRELIGRQVQEMAVRGLRVLAFARLIPDAPTSSVRHENVKEGLTFLGLQAMMDPPREEAIASVEACRQAGIQVKMITGDHVVTAGAIARQIGLDVAETDELDDFAISGHTLAELSDQGLVDSADKIAVFARVTPEQKLRLVEALQTHGHVVAMTGDGVNDAPALKQADIGVAMGMEGTEVAKEAADMVLTDDNFSTIEAAVEEGRAVFDNLVKFITWTLPTNVGEGLVILLAVFLGVALPITPVQILWINMTTAVLLGLMLAFEDKEPGIMARPPRRPDKPVITRELAIRIGLVSVMLVAGAFGFFEYMLLQGQSLEIARTVAVNMFVFGELFYLFNCRSLRYNMFQLGVFSNRWLIMGVTIMIGLQLLMTYVPTMNLLFGTAPIGLAEWGLILGGSFSIFAVVAIEKWLRRRSTGNRIRAAGRGTD